MILPVIQDPSTEYSIHCQICAFKSAFKPVPIRRSTRDSSQEHIDLLISHSASLDYNTKAICLFVASSHRACYLMKIRLINLNLQGNAIDGFLRYCCGRTTILQQHSHILKNTEGAHRFVQRLSGRDFHLIARF